MLLKILVGFTVAVAVFAIFVATRPSAYRVARTATMAAPPAAPFAEVNDFHRWAAWSPFAKMDPAMTQTYDGPAAGTGARYAWAGNGQVGEGRMTIVDSRPGDVVRIALEFLKPMPGTATAEFTFKPVGDQTAVTWSMAGESNFVAKAIGVFVSMDQMIGAEFEKGLADMKSIVEART